MVKKEFKLQELNYRAENGVKPPYDYIAKFTISFIYLPALNRKIDGLSQHKI